MSETIAIRSQRPWKEEPLPLSSRENRIITDNRNSAQSESIDSFEDLIWRFATEFTNSKEESEAAAIEIFADIQKYSVPIKAFVSVEDQLTTLMALRKLIRRLH